MVNGVDLAEKPMLFVVRAGGEVHAVLIAASVVVSDHESPESIDDYRIAGFIRESSSEMAVVAMESVYRSVTKVANQQVVRELAEFMWSYNDSPRRIQNAVRDQPTHQVSVRHEHVHESVSGSGNVIVAVGILFRVSNDQEISNRLNTERRESSFHVRVCESCGRPEP